MPSITEVAQTGRGRRRSPHRSELGGVVALRINRAERPTVRTNPGRLAGRSYAGQGLLFDEGRHPTLHDHFNLVELTEPPVDQFFGERVANALLDAPAHRTGPVDGLVAFLDQPGLDLVRHFEVDRAFGQALVQFAEEVSTIVTRCDFSSAWNTTTSSMRLRNSGLKVRLSSPRMSSLWRRLTSSEVSRWKPSEAPLMSLVPRLEVMMMTVFLKSTFRPRLSVRTPSSKTCKSTLKRSGCAFSISSKSTTEYGRRRTFSVSWPPSS